MRQAIVAVVLFSLLPAGCNREPPVPATHNYDLFGGRYFVDIETVGSFSMSNNVTNRQEGDKSVQLAEYKWQGHSLRLDNGKLTFDGKDYGSLKDGDRVRVDKDGRLSINGTQQP